MKKGDVGKAKHFSKKYVNKGWAINYVQSESYVKMHVNAWCYIPASLPPEPPKIDFCYEIKARKVMVDFKCYALYRSS